MMKDIKGYEGLYAITKQGEVWSYRSNKFLKNRRTSNGFSIELNVNGKAKSFIVARLVYATWNNCDYTKLNNGKFGYIDGDKYNVKLNNLSFVPNNSYDETQIKQIPYAPDYGITKNGDVWSYKTNKFLTHTIDKKFQVHKINLRVNGEIKYYTIHRLVLSTWNPVSNWENLQVNHKDENRNNNNLENLEWCDAQYNINYGTRNQRVAEKKKKQVKCIELDKIFNSINEAANSINVNPCNISACISGKQETSGGYHWELIL